MQNTKLITILSTFNAREIKAFQSFVRSPYYNQNDRLIKLLSLIVPGPVWEPSTILNKQSLHLKLFPSLSFEDKRMRYLFTDLCRLAERFLLEQEYQANTLQQRLDLARICNDRKLPKLYRQTIQKLEAYFEQQPAHDLDYFEKHLEFALIKDTHFQQQRIRKFDENLQWVADDLDRYYYLQKLRHACVMLDRQAIVTANYDLAISKNWLTL